MRMRIHGLLVLVLLTVSSMGCLSFSTDKPPRLVSRPAPVAKPLKAEVAVGDFMFRVRGGQMRTSYRQGIAINERVMDRWVKRGWISGYDKAQRAAFSNNADLWITLSGKEIVHSSITLGIFSGLTLLLIPNFSRAELSLIYEVENRLTGAKGVAKVDGEFRQVQELLLLPAWPAEAVGRNRTFDAVAENLFAQLFDQGVVQTKN
jgi:hypothetical protein